MKRKYRIHPGIGIARVGNSPKDFFIGPEAPGIPPMLNKPDAPRFPKGRYKDDQGRIKRQGARFRIYEYTYDAAGVLSDVREITAADAQIEWGVHLANRKAAAENFLQVGRRNQGLAENELVIDAQMQTIGGSDRPMQRLQGSFRGVAVPLGDTLTDSDGRLIVLGGFGTSRSVPPGQDIRHFANNDGWCDDVSDGPVTATVRLNGASTSIQAVPAWVIITPPDFAPPIENVITLYDVVYNAMVQLHPAFALRPEMPLSFTSYIYPILQRTTNYIWVSNLARRGHGQETDDYFIAPEILKQLANNERLGHEHDDHLQHTDSHETAESVHHHPKPTTPAERRHHIFEHLRDPHGGGGDMPMLNYIDTEAFVALTDFQYKLMQRWAEGDFESDWTGGPPAPLTLDQLMPRERPHALDRAALEACVGGGFFPGIEAGRIMRDPSIYDKKEPFRFSKRLGPGAITEKMAVPWQADFRDCGSGWWPAQRPNQVLRSGRQPEQWVPNSWKRETMIERWWELGFIVKKRASGKDRYVEAERNF
jgi:hypothetical protein